MRHRSPWVAALVLTGVVVGCSTSPSGGEPSTTSLPVPGETSTSVAGESAECPTEGDEFETAKLYIEHNATDEDTGVHGLFGGEAWSELCIWSPDGTMILFVEPRGPLGDLRVADLFFESREPPNDEYTIEDVKADFPEGEYVVGGTDFEGIARVGAATFTHDIPAEPTVITPELGEDEETAPQLDPTAGTLTISWDAVEETTTGDPVEITGYEVIITKVDHDDPNGWSRPVYDVHVGPEVLSLEVPPEFIELGTLYELEVLALEVSGNQTIHVGFFETSPTG